MHLVNKETGEEFHAPSGIGKALVATGTVQEVVPIPGPEVTVEWSDGRGHVIEDYQTPPVISWVGGGNLDRKSTRLNSSHGYISYAVFCLTRMNPGCRETDIGCRR